MNLNKKYMFLIVILPTLGSMHATEHMYDSVPEESLYDDVVSAKKESIYANQGTTLAPRTKQQQLTQLHAASSSATATEPLYDDVVRKPTPPQRNPDNLGAVHRALSWQIAKDQQGEQQDATYEEIPARKITSGQSSSPETLVQETLSKYHILPSTAGALTTRLPDIIPQLNAINIKILIDSHITTADREIICRVIGTQLTEETLTFFCTNKLQHLELARFINGNTELKNKLFPGKISGDFEVVYDRLKEAYINKKLEKLFKNDTDRAAIAAILDMQQSPQIQRRQSIFQRFSKK